MVSRLKKLSYEFDGGPGIAGVDPGGPMPILLNGPYKKNVNKDEINDITYGPSISREWLFEKPIDNPEWYLRSSNKKSRLKKKLLKN